MKHKEIACAVDVNWVKLFTAGDPDRPIDNTSLLKPGETKIDPRSFFFHLRFLFQAFVVCREKECYSFPGSSRRRL
jgi:hypothetical protein